MENCRYYIQHKFNSDSYVSKLSVSSGSSSWISLDRYRPNIFSYPLTFTSLSGMSDYIHNQFTIHYSENSSRYLDYNVMLDFQNMKIVKCSCPDPNPVYMYDIENYWQNSPEQMLRKSIWHFNCLRTFTPCITAEYEIRSNLQERMLGSNSYHLDEYYLDIHWKITGENQIIVDIANLGIVYNMISPSVIIIPKLEDLNFARLSIQGFSDIPTFHSHELLDMENRISFSSPIPLRT